MERENKSKGEIVSHRKGEVVSSIDEDLMEI